VIKNNKQKTIQTLLEQGVDINGVFTGENSTPLEVAIQYRHADLVEFLLQNEADANFHAEKSDPPIVIAVCKGNKKITELLLEYHVDVHMKWKDKTLLCSAFSDPYAMNFGVIQLLLEHGADANQKIGNEKKKDVSFYETPLHRAVRFQPEIALQLVTLLLKFGADVTAKNSRQQTPLDFSLNKYNHIGFFANQKVKHDILIKTLETAMKGKNDKDLDDPESETCTIF